MLPFNAKPIESLEGYCFLYKTASGENKLSHIVYTKGVQAAFNAMTPFVQKNYIAWYYA